MSAEPSDSNIVNEPPDDDVAIGESPDGDTIGGAQARRLVLTRRNLLKGAGTLAVFAAVAEGEFGSSTGGTLRGGTMALDKAYKISDREYLGPDSVKDSVISSIPESEGWLYHAADTDVTYYLDNNAWQLRNIGSSTTPVPSVTTESAVINRWATGYDYIIWRDADYIYAHDSKGELQYGGPDAKNVTNADDFGEILQKTVNSVDQNPSLRLAGPADKDATSGGTRYTFRSQANINHPFALWGPGRNRAFVETGVSTPIKIGPNPDHAPILRIDSVKFSGAGGGATGPWIHTDGIWEIILTHCEFKNLSPAVKFENVGTGYNAFIDSWFLPLTAGDTAIDYQGSGDLTVIGNRFQGGDVLIEDCNGLVRWGNVARDGDEQFQLTNVLYEPIPDIFSPSLNTNYPYPWQHMKSSTDTGSVTFNTSNIQIRTPGAAAAVDENRIYDDIIQFSPESRGSIKLHLSNVTIDNDALARLYFFVGTGPNSGGAPGDDHIGTIVAGDGTIFAQASEGGTSSNSTDSTQNNTYVNALDSVEIGWDGRTLTVTTDDGSTVVTVTHSTNYPSGENLFLKVESRDTDSGSALNVDFDIDAIEVGT